MILTLLTHNQQCRHHYKSLLLILVLITGYKFLLINFGILFVFVFVFFFVRLTSSMTGSDWLTYSQATFQIFSKNAVEGTPVQYGDVVGFKYPYSSNSAWFTNYGSRFYPRSCSCCNKSSCAKENTNTGFKIFKKLS